MAQADASQTKTYRLSDDPSFLTNQEKNHIYRVQHKRHRRISKLGGAAGVCRDGRGVCRQEKHIRVFLF